MVNLIMSSTQVGETSHDPPPEVEVFGRNKAGEWTRIGMAPLELVLDRALRPSIDLKEKSG